MYSYMRISDAFARAGHDIVISVNEWGHYDPWKWAPEIGHLWRTSNDITTVYGMCDWRDLVTNYDKTLGLYQYAGSNAFNDPDMMCIGLSGLDIFESRAHMSLWAFMSAPLIIAYDFDNVPQIYQQMSVQPKILAIDQDPLVRQAIPAVSTEKYDVLIKELHDGTAAMLYFNRGNGNREVSFDLNAISDYVTVPGWDTAKKYVCNEVWSGETYETPRGSESLLARWISPNDTAVFICSAE